jgi:hypothetical protein
MRLVALSVGSFDVAQDDRERESGEKCFVNKKWKPFALAHDCGRVGGVHVILRES